MSSPLSRLCTGVGATPRGHTLGYHIRPAKSSGQAETVRESNSTGRHSHYSSYTLNCQVIWAINCAYLTQMGSISELYSICCNMLQNSARVRAGGSLRAGGITEANRTILNAHRTLSNSRTVPFQTAAPYPFKQPHRTILNAHRTLSNSRTVPFQTAAPYNPERDRFKPLSP